MKNNYFKIFSLPLDFAVDQERLDDKYYQLIAASHPDSKTNSKLKPEDVNEGYKILQNDYSRLKHLLELTPGFQENANVLNPEFLMQFLQYQDELESGMLDADEITALKKKMVKEKSQIMQDVSDFRLVEKMDEASYEFAKLKFYVRIIEQIEEIEDQDHEAI